MSRTKAVQSFTWIATSKLLAERGVELHSTGLDEVPGVYKDIHAVMAAQTIWSKSSASSIRSS